MASDSDTLKQEMDELRASLEKVTKDVSAISQSLKQELKDQAGRVAGDIRDGARSVASDIGAKGKESAEVLEAAVRERPFQSLIMALGVGLLLAQFIRKR